MKTRAILGLLVLAACSPVTNPFSHDSLLNQTKALQMASYNTASLTKTHSVARWNSWGDTWGEDGYVLICENLMEPAWASGLVEVVGGHDWSEGYAFDTHALAEYSALARLKAHLQVYQCEYQLTDCPEERDYYPWWAPAPWQGIHVVEQAENPANPLDMAGLHSAALFNGFGMQHIGDPDPEDWNTLASFYVGEEVPIPWANHMAAYAGQQGVNYDGNTLDEALLQGMASQTLEDLQGQLSPEIYGLLITVRNNVRQATSYDALYNYLVTVEQNILAMGQSGELDPTSTAQGLCYGIRIRYDMSTLDYASY